MNSENAKSSTFSARKTRSDIRTYPRKLKKFKGDESIHLRTSSDFGRPSKTSHPMCTLHPIWWRAILINPSSPSKSWSILQNLQIRFNLQICHPSQGLDDRKFSVSENSSLAEFKSLHILHNFMWVSRTRSVGTLQGPAAKISCFKIDPLLSLTGKMIFPFKYIPGGTTKIWNLKINWYQPASYLRAACVWFILVGLYAVIMSDRGYNSCRALFALSWTQLRRWHQHLFRFCF